MIVKVRWSRKCAGGCGTWLRAGSSATKAYGSLWCNDCVALHRRDLPALAG